MRSLLFVVSLLWAAPAAANTPPHDVVERVVAVVDARPVLLSELRAADVPRVDRLALADREGVTALYRAALQELVDRRAVERAIDEARLAANDAEVARAIEAVRVRSGLAEWRFWLESRPRASHARATARRCVRSSGCADCSTPAATRTRRG